MLNWSSVNRKKAEVTVEGIISSHEAKTRFGELLNRVETGEEQIITRHGVPVAKMVPIGRISSSELQSLFEDITAHRKLTPLNLAGEKPISIRDLIDEGRK